MLAALRYRWAQAVVVSLLSALVTACLVLAPLYTRALEQAMVRTLIGEAPVEESGLRLTSSSSTSPALVLSADALVDLVPVSVRGLYGVPVPSVSVSVRRMPLAGEPGGRLLARPGMCEHVRFTAGRCPGSAGEIAVSADQAQAYAMPVGHRVLVGEFDGAVSLPRTTPRTTLRVVGVYEQVGADYWFGDRLTGPAAAKLGYDTMLTDEETLTGRVSAPDGGSTAWFEIHHAVDIPLVGGRVGIDQMGPLGETVAGLVEYPMGPERSASEVAETVTVRSGLPAIAEEVRSGSDQAGVTVPLLMAQMGLLLGCVLWLVLVAAADQRRGEVAVARLRGRGLRGARRLLLAETLPPVVLGAPLGALLAAGLSTVARQRVLTSDPPFEVPAAAGVALVVGVLLMVGLTLLSVRRVCREPVATLIRSVPPRRDGIRLGVLEAMLVAAAVAAFAALVTGAVGGPVGQVAPTLLALAVGVVTARVLSYGLGALGRSLLRRGRPTAGTALLAASRRGTTRWLVPVVTVALAIVVVTTDALAVGARNWTGRAQAEVGAPTVLTLDTGDLAAAAAALREADPGGRRVTPVAMVAPQREGGPATVGVDPDAFRRIALWPGADPESLPWDRLTAPTVPPLVLTGTRVAYHVESTPFVTVPPVLRTPPTALVLGLRVVRDDGSVTDVSLGTLGAQGVDADQEAAVDCAAGCRVTGIGVLTPPSSAAVSGRVTVSRLTVDGASFTLGAPGAWRTTATEAADITGSFEPDGVSFDFVNDGFVPLYLTHASVPDVVPGLTTGAATPTDQEATFAGRFVDGSHLLVRSAGTVAFVPGGPPSASVVNLANLLVQGWRGRGAAVVSAYLGTAEPGFVRAVTAVLADRGIAVVRTAHPEPVAAAYGRTGAAWSLQLALAVGGLSLLVAGVGIVVLAATSWRARSRDYAGLRLVGQSRRGLGLLAQLETAPVILCAGVVGAGVGLWAAPPAIAMMPLFTTTPATYPVDLSTAYGPAVLAALAGLLVLGLVGLVSNQGVARRADLLRVRGTA